MALNWLEHVIGNQSLFFVQTDYRSPAVQNTDVPGIDDYGLPESSLDYSDDVDGVAADILAVGIPGCIVDYTEKSAASDSEIDAAAAVGGGDNLGLDHAVGGILDVVVAKGAGFAPGAFLQVLGRADLGKDFVMLDIAFSAQAPLRPMP